jgi:hypothetical protein
VGSLDGGVAWRGETKDIRSAPDEGPKPVMWGVIVSSTNLADERGRRCGRVVMWLGTSVAETRLA